VIEPQLQPKTNVCWSTACLVWDESHVRQCSVSPRPSTTFWSSPGSRDKDADGLPVGDKVELLTYDMDIDALWKDGKKGPKKVSDSDLGSKK